MPEYVPFVAGDVRGEVLAVYEEDLKQWFMSAISGEVVKDNSGRTVWRVRTSNRRGLYVKRFKYPGLVQKVRMRISDKARQEFGNLRRLHDRRIACPMPVAYARDPESSWLITEELAEAEVIQGILASRSMTPSELRPMLFGLGAYVRGLHDAGLHHQDLHVGNLLIRKPADFYVLDVHRASVRAPLSGEERLDSVAFVLLSLLPYVSLSSCARFLKGYGADARKVWPRLREIRHRYYAGRLGRCLEDGSEYVRETKGKWTVYRRRAWDPGDLPFDESKRTLVKELPNRTLYRVGDRFLKIQSRAAALRTWKNAHGLYIREIPVARHDACGIDSDGWVLGEWLEALPLKEALEKTAQRQELLHQVARLVRRMHGRGVFHKDLKANNILIRGLDPFVIDLDRIGFALDVDEQDRILNLAQLNAAVGAPVTRTDRLRFFRWYCAYDRRIWRARKSWVRKIMRITVARKHVWPEIRS